jgi:Zn-dependent peptidase ImmA (M78 family)/transcriptional regulator with XRE-family HTH domain
MIGDRIKAARLTSGLSLRALAEKVGVSHQAIHKYESNKDIPSSSVLISLSAALGVKPEFFFRAERALEIAPAFRKHPSLSAKAEKRVMASLKEWLERYLELENLIPSRDSTDFPPPLDTLRITSLDDIEVFAENLRNAWGLGTAPIAKLMEFLEDRGVKVGVLDVEDDAFDACGFWVKLINEESASGAVPRSSWSRLGLPAIAIRSGVPGDRQRFSLAHELGHLLMQWLKQNSPEPPGLTEDSASGTEPVGVEAAANRFAGAFLVPRQVAYKELGEHRRNISLAEVQLLKLKYGLSMQAWLRRALELGIISEELETRLFRELKSQGAPKTEPGEPVPSEEPGRLMRMALRAVAEGVVTRSRASELAGAPLQGI